MYLYTDVTEIFFCMTWTPVLSPTLISSSLTPLSDSSISLQEMVNTLPPSYKQLLGEFTLPHDDGAALAHDLAEGTLAYYSEGSVKDGCAAHAYPLQPKSDNEALAITGGGPTCGDLDMVSSLRSEHNGTLAGSIWLWLLEIKHAITSGEAQSGIDNSTVITRLS